MQSYTHFTLEERIKLQELRKKNLSIRAIARELGRSPSTVSRELKRNRNKNGSYNYWRATVLYITRRKNSHKRWRLAADTKLGDFVRRKLDRFHSPECIAAVWNRRHPDDHVAFSTIYRWLKRGLLFGYSRKQHLRRRGKRIQTRKANYNTIKPDRLIDERPEVIEKRLRVGDWEGDTVYGAPGKGLIVTCVDRKSRYLQAALLMNKTAEQTLKAMKKALDNVIVKSLSLDNGSEFSLFRELEAHLGAPIYFAKPHSPWERGSNENMNGILRFFFPKGFDFTSITREELDYVVHLINTRPRKCLDWKTPEEIFLEGVALD